MTTTTTGRHSLTTASRASASSHLQPGSQPRLGPPGRERRTELPRRQHPGPAQHSHLVSIQLLDIYHVRVNYQLGHSGSLSETEESNISEE